MGAQLETATIGSVLDHVSEGCGVRKTSRLTGVHRDTVMGRTHPLPAFIFIVFFLSLAGIPPTAGFVGKLLIFRAAIDAGFVWLAIIGVATSAIAAYYYFMVIKTMYMDEPTGAVALSSSRPLSVGLAIMVVATILLGLFPNLVLQATEVTRIVQ